MGRLSAAGLDPHTLTEIDDGREVWAARTAVGQEVTVVRARTLRAALRVRRERALIRSLKADGVRAAPELLSGGVLHYAVETGEVLRRSRGRRTQSRAAGAPRAAEAEAAVRRDLEQLCEALNARELALGHRPGAGLLLRSDGSALVTDFSSLREATFAAHRADVRWIESVMGGGEVPASIMRRQAKATLVQTPRRARPAVRIALSSAAATVVLAAVVAGGVLTGGGVPIAGVLQQTGADLSAGAGRHDASDGAEKAGSGVAVPLQADNGAGATSPDSRSGPGADTAPSGAQQMSGDPVQAVSALADARRDYVIGAAGENAAVVEGSPAAVDDARLRQRFAVFRVDGGVTTVHEVQVLERDDQRCRIRARISDSPMTLTDEKGRQRQVPAGAERTVVMELAREPDGWRIVSVRADEQESSAAAGDTVAARSATGRR
ncbi:MULTISPECIES: hypothetical protein [Helcobacillus]|uniref:Uncharacterized protein n=1 Tax=Helcobacillus massiliensis TaxID=521392 RepID=A0A839QYJ2_9MICO|nr:MULTISPECIES: hypothetical protein [Helcobacillus]MBB3022477.1 hypothetical protein [Helcobacillus massiliensis]MCG7427311.1 hypothetical protein [Helcobacillus sp. ACRRO]